MSGKGPENIFRPEIAASFQGPSSRNLRNEKHSSQLSFRQQKNRKGLSQYFRCKRSEKNVFPGSFLRDLHKHISTAGCNVRDPKKDNIPTGLRYRNLPNDISPVGCNAADGQKRINFTVVSVATQQKDFLRLVVTSFPHQNMFLWPVATSFPLPIIFLWPPATETLGKTIIVSRVPDKIPPEKILLGRHDGKESCKKILFSGVQGKKPCKNIALGWLPGAFPCFWNLLEGVPEQRPAQRLFFLSATAAVPFFFKARSSGQTTAPNKTGGKP